MFPVETSATAPAGLDRFTFVDTDDIDLSLAAARRVFGPDVTVDVGGDLRRIHWRLSRVDLGPVVLSRGEPRAESFHLHGDLHAYFVFVADHPGMELGSAGSAVPLIPGRSGGILSAALPGSLRGAGELANTSLVIDPAFLTAQLEALTGAPVRELPRFPARLDTTTGPGASIERLIRFLLAEITAGSDLFTHPILAADLAGTLARALLLGLPHDHAHLLARAPRLADLAAVRKAEEHLDACAAEPVQLSEIATLTGHSLQAIDAAFRLYRGTTAQGFLHRRRLARAYAAQLREQPEGRPAEHDDLARFEAALAALSPREREVCALVARGLLNKQIAAELGITEATVKVHRRRMMARLGVGSTAELVRRLERAGRPFDPRGG